MHTSQEHLIVTASHVVSPTTSLINKAFPSSLRGLYAAAIAALSLTSCDPQKPPAVETVALNGTWETPCFLVPGQQLKSKTKLVYVNLKLTGTYTDYADDGCTVIRGQSTWTGTATIGAAAADGSKKLDLAFDTYRYKPAVAEAAMVNNQYMYCGFSDWAANVEKDVMGRMCYGFSIPQSGKSFDIYKVEGTTLKFGKDSKISATPQESERPAAIDDSRVFTRVGA